MIFIGIVAPFYLGYLIYARICDAVVYHLYFSVCPLQILIEKVEFIGIIVSVVTTVYPYKHIVKKGCVLTSFYIFQILKDITAKPCVGIRLYIYIAAVEHLFVFIILIQFKQPIKVKSRRKSLTAHL